jgi:menaquinone-dependent protoporphyrinogen oxidase
MRVLVSVSSRHGGTEEIGRHVAAGLRDVGHEADEIAPDDVLQVVGYDAVVLGTSVYVGRVGLDLKDLVARQGAALKTVPVWLFWSGPVVDEPEQFPIPEDVIDAAHEAGARQVRVFGGRVERGELSVTEKSLLALVSAQPGDHRDLEGAFTWGQRVGTEMGRRIPIWS